MNTTQSLHAGVALGLAQTATTASPVPPARLLLPSAVRRKTLVLGLLAVASCAAVVLVSKAAMMASEVFARTDAIYQAMSN